MQFKQTLVRLLVFLSPFVCSAQTTFLPQGDKQNILLERMEIKLRTDSVLNFSKTKPFSRKAVIGVIKDNYLSPAGSFSKTDIYNMRSALLNNLEWVDDKESFKTRKPILKAFYKTPANMFEVHVKDFDLVVNPVIQFTVSKEKDSDYRLFQNTRGVTVRGKIADRIGFAAYMTENQERDPSYVQQWISDRKALPGQGFYKRFKSDGGVDYFDARGYITFGVTKYIDVVFGYDKNFIGNGYRSLFLSDFGNSNLFLKLNTRIWKFNYQNLFMELHNADSRTGDRLISKKYAAMHHLDIDITKWLNIGLFEGITFGRENRFDFGYLNPIIFYRSIEQQNGSFDNAVVGLDVKANLLKSVQLYGQLLLDEFRLSEVKAHDGWWGNKYAFQLGAKYIDAFRVKNLDLQAEFNFVRPFTYSHDDSVANYTHYNQPLAHPLMANFKEYIGILRYQPAPKWMVQVKAILYQQGRDSSSASYGSNIFLPNGMAYRQRDYGFNILSGWRTDVLYTSLLVAYEFRENLFIELFGVYRKQETKTPPLTSMNTSVVSLGIRWNMHRREFDF